MLRRKKGKHRGKYRPSWHWAHLACYPWGCHVATRVVNLHVYQDFILDVDGGGLRHDEIVTPNMQTFSFSETETILA